MARRKRKDDTPVWVAPDFDEVGFMRREIEGARAAVATVAGAIVGALVVFALSSLPPVLAFWGGIAVGFGMYFIFPLFGFKTESFKRRDWIGHGITYFFSWLAFWIILLNPPFSDHVPPTIQSISVSPYHGGYTPDLGCPPPPRPVSRGPSKASPYILFSPTANVGPRIVEVA